MVLSVIKVIKHKGNTYVDVSHLYKCFNLMFDLIHVPSNLDDCLLYTSSMLWQIYYLCWNIIPLYIAVTGRSIGATEVTRSI